MLDQYCTELENNLFSFTREQSSNFAKDVANDFNPLHDVDTRKFCVPGDLLFAHILLSEGLFEDMTVYFGGMVSDGVALRVVTGDKDNKRICDSSGKEYLRIEHSGEKTSDKVMIEKLIRAYVSFSGKNFPHVLVPLMKEKNAMINVTRPLVIYESMAVQLDRIDLQDPEIKAFDATLTVNGKRGHVKLEFLFKDHGVVVGKGFKTMVLANLREYDDAAIDEMVNEYDRRRLAHKKLTEQ